MYSKTFATRSQRTNRISYFRKSVDYILILYGFSPLRVRLYPTC